MVLIIITIIIVSLVYYYYNLYNKTYKYSEIGIFSEGNQYYSTFYPIIEELIKRKIQFNYYTLDRDDKLLEIKNKYLNSYYLGSGLLGYFRFNNIKSNLLLSTTPNIGNKNFPLKYPTNIKSLIHVWHSISDIGYYRKGALDNYDIILTVGKFQNKSIEQIMKQRNTRIKHLVPVGLPYFDYFLKNFESKSNNNDSILIASSWGNKGLLKNHGLKLLDFLKDRKVIIRPHPQSFYSEKKFIENLKSKCSAMENVHWDESESPLDSFKKSSMLISDTSSIRFDYSFLTSRPVITLQIKTEELKEYEFNYIKERWDEKNEKIIGKVINEDNLNTLIGEIDSLNKNLDNTSCIQKLKKETLYSAGESSKNIVDFLLSKKSGS